MEVYPIQRKMIGVPLPQFSLRSRREVNTQDQVNSLHVEKWETDAPWLAYDRPDISGQRYFLDMNPINSRTVDRSYLQNQPFVVGNSEEDQFQDNPYFMKFDVKTDPFNVARELRATVYEDKVDRGLLESRRLLTRTYTTRYEPENWVETRNLNTLKAYEEMRPQMNNMERTYRPYQG